MQVPGLACFRRATSSKTDLRGEEQEKRKGKSECGRKHRETGTAAHTWPAYRGYKPTDYVNLPSFVPREMFSYYAFYLWRKGCEPLQWVTWALSVWFLGN